MAFSALIEIQDSTGKRIDTARRDGAFDPVVLKMSADFAATSSNSGGLSTVSLSIAAALAADSYIAPTGSGGTAGLSIGRYDIAPSGAIPGVWGVKNTDGSGLALKVDNTAALTSSAWTLQVGGTSGAQLTQKSLDLPTWNSAISNPASGSARLRFDGATIYAKDSSGSDVGLQVAGLTANALTLGSALTIGNGGTGILSIAPGALLYGPASGTALSPLAIGGAGTVLTSNGSVPEWALAPYSAGSPSQWAEEPTTVQAALDDLANAAYTLLGATPIPHP